MKAIPFLLSLFRANLNFKILFLFECIVPLTIGFLILYLHHQEITSASVVAKLFTSSE